MQSDGEPKISGALQGETKKHGDHHHARRADQPFALISKMYRAKCARQNSRGRPEANSGGQSELRVATEAVFFENSYEQKTEKIEESFMDNFVVGKRNGAEGVAVKCSDQSDHYGNCGHAPQHSFPEAQTECLIQRHSVQSPRALFNERHQHGRQRDCEREWELAEDQNPSRHAALIPLIQTVSDCRDARQNYEQSGGEHRNDANVNKQAPTGANAAGTNENCFWIEGRALDRTA